MNDLRLLIVLVLTALIAPLHHASAQPTSGPASQPSVLPSAHFVGAQSSLSNKMSTSVSHMNSMSGSVGIIPVLGIDLFVLQGSGTQLYKIEGSATGFVRRSGMGSLDGIQIVGVTGRVQRAENLVVYFTGSSIGEVKLTTSSTPPLYFDGLKLPGTLRYYVPTNPAIDNITWTFSSNGTSISRRVPIGSR